MALFRLEYIFANIGTLGPPASDNITDLNELRYRKM